VFKYNGEGVLASGNTELFTKDILKLDNNFNNIGKATSSKSFLKEKIKNNNQKKVPLVFKEEITKQKEIR